ncbi:MAG: hypothetical protein HY650_10270 [Acidobacteria bacterium]|nr:hypothetical protein [Acidobacteriota bacterium]
MLLTSSFVTTLLIPPEAYREGGPASGRALAYLAHDLFGHSFGTLYDLSTIVILWFAGASAMAALLNLIPCYLPRYGMAPWWALNARPLVLVIFLADLLVTIAFEADVEAQGGAYATGVLVLLLSAALAVALSFWRESGPFPDQVSGSLRTRSISLFFWLISLVFVYTLLENVLERPDGVIIASLFILVIILLSGISRYRRSTEFRVERMAFIDQASKDLWPLVSGKKVHLVPLRRADPASRRRKRQEILRYYQIQDPVAFVNVQLLDNRSDFLSPLQIRIRPDGDDFLIEILGAIAIANSLAYLSEQIDPISLMLGLTRQNLMTQAFKYLLWGEGEVGLSVYAILIRYWDWTKEDDVRPLIFLMSE